jgi:hypothetical protein
MSSVILRGITFGSFGGAVSGKTRNDHNAVEADMVPSIKQNLRVYPESIKKEHMLEV